MRRFVWAALLGSAALLIAADTAQAQISFGFGRGRGGGWGGGRDSWYVDTPYGSYGRGYSPYYGDPYWGGRGFGRGFGYGDYGYGWGGSRFGPSRGFGVTVGSPMYSSGYYSTPGFGYSSSPVYQSSYQSGFGVSAGMSTQDRALIHVMLPVPDAELWFEDASTEQKGFHRVFITPEGLESGKQYVYHVKAKWMEGGREVTREKTIDVRAGRETRLAFGEREGEGQTGVRSAEYFEREPGRGERRDAELRGERRDTEIRSERRDIDRRDIDRRRPEGDAREIERDNVNRNQDPTRTPSQDPTRNQDPTRPAERSTPPSGTQNNNPPPQ